eukprot:scaffold654_cov207-Ochromonas_danica.AAC.43
MKFMLFKEFIWGRRYSFDSSSLLLRGSNDEKCVWSWSATENESLGVLFLTYCYLSIIQLPAYYDILIHPNVLFIFPAVGLMTVFFSMWISFFYQCFANHLLSNSQHWHVYWRSKVPWMRTYTVVGCTIWFIFRLLTRTIMMKECHDGVDSWSCTQSEMKLSLTHEAGACLMTFPLLFSIIYREQDVKLYFSLWAMTIAALFTAVYLLGNNQLQYQDVFIYCLLSLIVIFETYRCKLYKTSIMMELQKVTKEKEEMSNQMMHASETRHMIANVAHDLKTPLMSFLSAIELISGIALECQQNIRDKNVNGMESNILSVLNCVQNIRSMNSFMLMTINRCLDYTKASNGLKLVPKFETVDLLQTLLLPLNCMKDIQQRISIVLDPLPQEICSHIITDKQWLQENVLCLLSNAVKYSSGGEVKVMLKMLSAVSTKSDLRVMRDISGVNDPSCVLSPRKNSQSESPRTRASSSQIFPTVLMQPNISAMNANETNDDRNLEVDRNEWKCESESFLRIEIEDEGIGLSEEAMTNLFNPFKQAQRLAGGTGLGLYSLARRVDALNGTYGVAHRGDGKQGSVFWFSIPYRPDVMTAGSMLRKSVFSRRNFLRASLSTIWEACGFEGSDSDSERRSVGFNRSLRGNEGVRFVSSDSTLRMFDMDDGNADEGSVRAEELNILLVDDSAGVVKMMSMMLRRLGHQITIAENGDVALKLICESFSANRTLFDVVLMDLQMPVMDGLEATRRLRAFEHAMIARFSGAVYVERDSGLFSSSAGYENAASGADAMDRSMMENVCRMVSLGQLHLLVIGVSANSDHETMQDAMNAGVDAFMAKPFSIEMFYATYEKLTEECNMSNR